MIKVISSKDPDRRKIDLDTFTRSEKDKKRKTAEPSPAPETAKPTRPSSRDGNGELHFPLATLPVAGEIPVAAAETRALKGTFAQPTIQELRILARHDFAAFFELTFSVLHPGQKLTFADYMYVLADMLMGIESGKYKKAIVNLPPRFMKSMIVSVYYVAWRLGRDPTAKFLTVSYSQELAKDHAYLMRDLMQSAIYKSIFRGTRITKNSVDYVRTTKGGYRKSNGFGDLTGFGAEEIIIDDPIEPKDALSERALEAVRQFVSSSVLTRFNQPSKAKLLLVMHRLSPADLSVTLEGDADIVIRLPMIAEQDEIFRDETGRITMSRRPGDLLNPNHMTPDGVDGLRRSVGSFVWESQYQQRPTLEGSGMLSMDKLVRFDKGKEPAFELLIHSWDIGATIQGNASVCTVWGLANVDGQDTLYLTDLIRLKLELPDVRASIIAQDKKDRPAMIVLDERGVGLGIWQDLKKTMSHIETSSSTQEAIERDVLPASLPTANKIFRFAHAAYVLTDGLARIPRSAPWLDGFLNELLAFPNSADKDRVDSMTQLLSVRETAIRRARMHKDRRGR